MDNDDNILLKTSRDSPSISVSVDNNNIKPGHLDNCQVLLDDVLSGGFTEKFRTLKLNPDQTHSVSSRHALEKHFLENIQTKDPIAWPKMNNDSDWEQLDSAVGNILVNLPSLFERVSLLEDSIYNKGSLLFGFIPKKQKTLKGLNRRAKHSIELVKQKNQLISQINSTLDPYIKHSLTPLLNQVQSKLRCLRRGESSRKRRWKIKKANQDFFKNPYNAGKKVLDPDCNFQLECQKTVLDNFKSCSLFDEAYNIPLSSLEGLPPPPKTSFEFNSSALSFDDFFSTINTRRNASSPGINMIPYKVYKKCPRIASYLFKIFQSSLKLKNVPIQWRLASEVFIPKKKPPCVSKIEDFRPITLLNVEGKLFFSLIAKRLETHIINQNKFINTSLQKGCIAKVPGCCEHMSLVWQELKSTKSDKKNISAVWLDIANAYGSIPHQLIFLALERYGVDPTWIDIIRAYYAGIWSKSFSPKASSSWHQHLRGIFTGCTVSIILFLSGMNIILEFIMAGIDTSLLMSSPSIKAFMDDLYLMSPSFTGTQTLLNRANIALTWARMSVKPSKSRSLIMVKGRTVNDKHFVISSNGSENRIPSIAENPVKFLGRTISDSLSDHSQIENVKQALNKALSLINSSKHRSVHKIWILHHLLIPRLRWPLMIYEFALSVVVKLEQKISFFIRKWLRLNNTTTNICLYSSSSPCPLPIKSLSSVLKSAKVSGQLLLNESVDPYVSSSNVSLSAGNLNIPEVVNAAENKLNFKNILGYHQSHRAGFGSLSIPEVPPKHSHAYRKLISSMVDELDEEKQLAKAVQLGVQGQWTKWCSFVRLDLSWKTMLAIPQPLLTFALASTYDTLPSPSRLHRWGKIADPSCLLCNKPICTTPHVLGACNIALKQGRFTFRHDSVLAEIYSSINSFLSNYKVSNIQPTSIKFVKAGDKAKKSNKKRSLGLLHAAPDWKLLCDLDSKLVFPSFIAVTVLCPDIVLYSVVEKTVILIELTCPCEENMEQWHQTKYDKYEPLSSAIKSNGWKVNLFPIEVGARGYCSTSVKSCFQRLGFSNKQVRSTLKSLSFICLKASFQIWQARETKNWVTPTVSMPESGTKSHCQVGKRFIEVDKTVSLATCVRREGFLNSGLKNKGNTCYINASLQCFSTMEYLWSNISLLNNNLPPFINSFLRLMSLLRSSKAALDPSQFLRHLKVVLIRSGKSDFNIFSQQDAGEILSSILIELCSFSPHAQQALYHSLRNEITCNSCLNSSINEESSPILHVPVANTVQASLSELLKSEELLEEASYFCNYCSGYRPAIVEHSFSKVGQYLVVQLKRFTQQEGVFKRDIQKVFSTPNIEVTVVDGDLTSQTKYQLIATVNHTGTLDKGHYTAFIKPNKSKNWLFCNDAAVLGSSEASVNNTSSYICFYEKC